MKYAYSRFYEFLTSTTPPSSKYHTTIFKLPLHTPDSANLSRVYAISIGLKPINCSIPAHHQRYHDDTQTTQLIFMYFTKVMIFKHKPCSCEAPSLKYFKQSRVSSTIRGTKLQRMKKCFETPQFSIIQIIKAIIQHQQLFYMHTFPFQT